MDTELLDNAEIIIYKTEDGNVQVDLYEKNESIWLSKSQLAKLFDTSVQNIGTHLRNCFKEGELIEESVKKVYSKTSTNRKYKADYYNLEAILAVAFRVRSPRGVQFRVWANEVLQEYLKKGFIIDQVRLKNPDGQGDYFDELLAQIRDIRASEKRFYQKLRDLFKLSIDYDVNKGATDKFFSETQNKLLYAVTGKTAAEIVASRVDASKPNMALTSWLKNKVRKRDIYIAKNYLEESEVSLLNRLVVVFLEDAELRVSLRKTLTLDYWRENVNKLLQDYDLLVLEGHGSISREEMIKIADCEYDKFDQIRKEKERILADEEDIFELEQLSKLGKG